MYPGNQLEQRTLHVVRIDLLFRRNDIEALFTEIADEDPPAGDLFFGTQQHRSSSCVNDAPVPEKNALSLVTLPVPP